MRDNSLIPWDNDVDIGTWNTPNKEKIIETFIEKGFRHKKKLFGQNNLISFEKGKNRVIDIKPSLNLNTNNEKINDELKDRFRPEFLSS